MSYLEAALPEPTVVLGMKLRPLSLGHLHILDRLQSPFVAGGDITPEELVNAVLVCAMTHGEWLELVDSEDKVEQMQQWADSLGQIDWQSEAETFIEYFNAGVKGPNYRAPANKGGATNAPVAAQIKVALMSEFGMSEREALDRPYALSLWDLAVLSERRGALTIETDEMRAEYLEAKRLADELDKRRN